MNAYQILIVDDQKDIRRLLSGGLQTLGQEIQIIEVPSAEEAMLLAPRQRFDLIVTDVRLPGISGLDLVKRLKKFNPSLKIILMTGANDSQIRKQVEEAGTFAFFYKPIEMSDFLDAVERALGLVATVFPPPPLSLEPQKKNPTTQPIPVEPALHAPTKPAQRQPPSSMTHQPPSSTAHQPAREVLADLLRKVGASAVVYLDLDGKVVQQVGNAGDLAAEGPLFTAAVRAARSNISLSRVLGRVDPEYLFCIDGSRYHLCLTPIGRTHILLLIGLDTFRSRLADLEKFVLSAAVDLMQPVEPSPAPAPVESAPPPPEAQPAPEPDLAAALAQVEVTSADLAAIDNLFSAGLTSKSAVSNLDDFWNSAAEEAGSMKQNDNQLTYDQARQLGLTPDH